MHPYLIELIYLAGTALFIFSLHWMSDPKTAKKSVAAGAIGMALAILATWARPEVTRHLWVIIPIVLAIGPGALQYLGAIDWSALVGPTGAFFASGVVAILMRFVTTTPVGKPVAPETAP